MPYWAAVFLVMAIVAAAIGFGGLAFGATGIAKTLFIIFIVLFAISLFFGITKPRRSIP